MQNKKIERNDPKTQTTYQDGCGGWPLDELEVIGVVIGRPTQCVL